MYPAGWFLSASQSGHGGGPPPCCAWGLGREGSLSGIPGWDGDAWPPLEFCLLQNHGASHFLDPDIFFCLMGMVSQLPIG